MTKEELIKIWSNKISSGGVVKIKHKNNTTVEFYPTSYEEDETHYNINGWWIMIQSGNPIVQEEIHIIKEDLKNWNIANDF